LAALLTIQEGDAGIYVTGIVENGSAAQDGRLRVGDKILSVNGAPCISITHSEAVALLQACTTSVALCVSRELMLHTAHDQIVSVLVVFVFYRVLMGSWNHFC
jgi:C-terminal processing protease CtpA/Prc